MRLEGANEVERLEGWEDLETRDFYSQGNWKDLNEFFEYCTEWEPTNSLYFGGKFWTPPTRGQCYDHCFQL
jgi:hypothetical protein